MKKKGIIILLLAFILSISFAGALTITPGNLSLNAKETGIISVKGVFYEALTEDKVQMKRNNVIVPINFGIHNFGDGEWILWFISPESAGNYTIWINDISMAENGAQVEKDIGVNVSVSNNSAKYSIKPETLNPSGNFSIIITSYGDDNRMIDINYPISRQIILKPGENEIVLGVNSIYGTKRVDIRFGDYSIPFLIAGSAKAPTPSSIGSDIIISPAYVIKEGIIFGEGYNFNFTIRNKLDKEITGIKFEYSKEFLSILSDKEFSLDGGEDKIFFVKLIKEIRDDYSTTIKIKYSNISIDFPVGFDVIKPGENKTSESGYNQTIEGGNQLCEELNGVKCIRGEKCSVDLTDSLDGACCLGTCQQQKSKLGGWIGIILFAIVLIIAGYVYWTFKRSPKNGEEGKTRLSHDVKKPMP